MLILLADDTEINRLYLSESLLAAGFEVRVVTDGLEALRLARAERFDALVLDERMPGCFGSEVLTKLRREPQAASHAALAVAITSELAPELGALLLQTGFSAAMAKPINIVSLVQALHRKLPDGSLQLSSGARHDDHSAPRFDDAQAIRALGRPELVGKLRRLMRRELLARRCELSLAIAQSHAPRVRELVHQSLASCAMCGTPKLELALLRLREAVLLPDWIAAQARLQAVLGEIELLLQELPP